MGVVLNQDSTHRRGLRIFSPLIQLELLDAKFQSDSAQTCALVEIPTMTQSFGGDTTPRSKVNLSPIGEQVHVPTTVQA